MFVECFSDHVAERHYWPAVFYLENTIRAILLEDGEAIRNISSENFRELICELGKPMGFPDNCPEPRPPQEWIDAFLDREAPNLIAIVQGFAEGDNQTISPYDSRLGINLTQLRKCISLDEVFRCFLATAVQHWQMPAIDDE